jgi:hypothetical protein
MLLVVFGSEDLNGQPEIPYGSENIYAYAVKRGARFFGVTAIFRDPFGAFFAYTAIAQGKNEIITVKKAHFFYFE